MAGALAPGMRSHPEALPRLFSRLNTPPFPGGFFVARTYRRQRSLTMVDIAFHHGTRVFESAEKPVTIRTAQSAVIFLLGTAPEADAEVFPLNKPILITGASNYALAAQLGADGTLKHDLDAIFDQGGVQKLGAYVYVCRVEEGDSVNDTLSNLVGDGPSMTGVHAA